MPIQDSRTENFSLLVIEDWTAAYSDPIRVSAGDPVKLNGREDIWDGHTWLWAESNDGKEGWIPDCIVSKGAHPKATETYSATELTCRKGQSLKAEKRLHGWVWCSDQNGKQGWVPERNLNPFNRS
jgi:hypothetical protein